MKTNLLIITIIWLVTVNNAYTQQTGTIYFIRSTGVVGFAQPYSAFIDQQLVCKLNDKKFSIHAVEPGDHTFTVQFYGKASKKSAEPISITVESGKTYYIQLVFARSWMSDNLSCLEVTENSARTLLEKCTPDPKCL